MKVDELAALTQKIVFLCTKNTKKNYTHSVPARYLSRAENKTEHDADSTPSTRKHILNLVNHYIFFLSIEKSFTLLGRLFGDDDCSASKLFFPTPFDQYFEKVCTEQN